MTEQTVYEINPAEVVVLEGRQRQIFNREKMKELVDAILELGQKSPGLCRITDGKVTLIFGERRLRACLQIGIPFKYILEEETDPYKLARIEFLENIAREDLDFKDEARAISKFHEMSQQYAGVAEAGAGTSGHGLKETAFVANMSKTKVQEELELAKFLALPEVANAKNRTEARKTIKRIKENFYTEKALDEAREKAGITRTDQQDSSEDSTTSIVSDKKSREDYITERLAFYDPLVVKGSMENKLNDFPDGHFDVVCFDPPWGVDFDKVYNLSGSKLSYNDKVEFMLDKMYAWIEALYLKMAENSHLYMFFGMGSAWQQDLPDSDEDALEEGFRFRDKFYALLESIGFKTNRMPLIWYKQGAHVTRNPDVWPGRSYEPIAYARKGSKNLLKKGAPDVIITPMPWASLKKSHPSAKHPDIYLELLKRSCMPGDKVLDPMCGSGMMGVAAETMRVTHQLDWHMIEQKKEFVNLALTNLIAGYSGLIKKSDTERKES